MKMSSEAPLQRHVLNGATMGTRYSAVFFAPAGIDLGAIGAAPLSMAMVGPLLLEASSQPLIPILRSQAMLSQCAFAAAFAARV